MPEDIKGMFENIQKETDETKKAELQKQLDDKLKEMQTSSEELKSIKDKGLFKELEETRKKLKDLEDTKKLEEEKKLTDNNEFKTLAETREKELKETKEKLSELESYKSKFEEMETATRNELLAELPDEHKTIAEKLELTALRDYVKLNKKQDPVATGGNKGGAGKIVTEGKTYDDFTTKELDEIIKTNPSLYNKLYKEKFNKHKIF